MKAYRVVDYVQWVWKKVYNIDKSKSEIRRDLNQGSIRLNDKKLTVDDVIVLDTKDPN